MPARPGVDADPLATALERLETELNRLTDALQMIRQAEAPQHGEPPQSPSTLKLVPPASGALALPAAAAALTFLT